MTWKYTILYEIRISIKCNVQTNDLCNVGGYKIVMLRQNTNTTEVSRNIQKYK